MSGTLLVYAEQGYGDAIQFARFLPLAKERCDRLVVQCQPSLVRLFQRLECVDEVTGHTGKGGTPEHDRHAGMMSLPYLLGIDSVEKIPKPADFRIERREFTPGFPSIGFVWAGSEGFSVDRDRSAPPGVFGPLLDEAWGKAHLVSLQVGAREQEYLGLARALLEATDWLDTAEQLASLDLLIAVDTGVAHLAGSLGVPTWLIPPTHPEWRWLLDYPDSSPWYPTHKLFRRKHTDDWPETVARIKGELERLVSGG